MTAWITLPYTASDRQLLIRMDSSNDAIENPGILLEDHSWFIVKRNLRSESKEAWLGEMKRCCQDIRIPCEGKTVYVGFAWREISYLGKDGKPKSETLRIPAFRSLTNPWRAPLKTHKEK